MEHFDFLVESHDAVAVGIAPIHVSGLFLRRSGRLQRLARPVVRSQFVTGSAGASVGAHFVDAVLLAVAVSIQALVHVCKIKL